MVTTIKAIETEYNGYRFRSRLEARWAVFMDCLGVKYTYEMEGYELEGFGRYLPDFTILDDRGEPRYWIEIKAHRNLSAREYNVAYALSDHLPGYILVGSPEVPVYCGPKSAILPISQSRNGFIPFSPGGAPEPDWNCYQGSWAIEFGKMINMKRRDAGEFGYFCPVWRLSCWHERTDDHSILLWPVPAQEPMIVSLHGTADPLAAGVKSINSPYLRAAYTAARQARFEHGEHGR